MWTSQGISGYLLLSINCFSAFISALTARPSIDAGSQFLSTPEPSPLRGVWTPRSHGRNPRALPERGGASMFEKRMYPYESSIIRMRQFGFKTVATILPVTEAARFLEDFYSSIARKASGEWQSQPETYEFSIEQGPFRLSFASMGEPVSWHFVKSIAETLWESACLGFAEFFDAYYIDDSGRIAASVGLRFADGEGGPSSRWSSNTNWREGSVPSVGSPYD